MGGEVTGVTHASSTPPSEPQLSANTMYPCDLWYPFLAAPKPGLALILASAGLCATILMTFFISSRRLLHQSSLGFACSLPPGTCMTKAGRLFENAGKKPSLMKIFL